MSLLVFLNFPSLDFLASARSVCGEHQAPRRDLVGVSRENELQKCYIRGGGRTSVDVVLEAGKQVKHGGRDGLLGSPRLVARSKEGRGIRYVSKSTKLLSSSTGGGDVRRVVNYVYTAQRVSCVCVRAAKHSLGTCHECA